MELVAVRLSDPVFEQSGILPAAIQFSVCISLSQYIYSNLPAQILRKQACKDVELAALQKQREAEAARTALERRLLLKHKAETVEEMKRREAWEREQALKKIQDETQRSKALLAQRNALQVINGFFLVYNVYTILHTDCYCQGWRFGAHTLAQACTQPITMSLSFHSNNDDRQTWSCQFNGRKLVRKWRSCLPRGIGKRHCPKASPSTRCCGNDITLTE